MRNIYGANSFVLRVLLTAVGFLMTIEHVPAADPFKFVIFGDTQRYPRAMQSGAPDLFTIQTKWVKENAVAENIAFLTHVGDVIQDSATLWPFADSAMSEIDGVIPYGVTFGNHDGGAPGPFGAARYQGYPWYLGASSDDLAHAQKFTAAGTTYLHINLPHSPKALHLTWAQGIIDANLGKPTIISTHGYFADNGVGRDGNGNTVWNGLVEPNEQVFMTCCGHDWVSRHEIDTTTSGRKVLQVMVNYQQIINGGQGWFQMAEFDPDNHEIRFETYSPFVKLNRTDISSQFTISATFGAGTLAINGETGLVRDLWTGGGTDSNWLSAANWGGMAPVAGNILEFKGSAKKVSVNNFPAGTSFGGILFPQGNFSGGYQFSGNSITLTGDIVNMGGYGPNTAQSGPMMDLPITLVGDRQVNTGDWDMTLSGVISGNGSLTKTHGRDYINGSYDGGVRIGDLYLTKVNSYSGATSITGGALVLLNSSETNLIPASSEIITYHNAVLVVNGLQNGTIVLAPGQTLKGGGKVLGKTSVQAGASIAPGHSDHAILYQIGDLTMASGSALGIRFSGSSLGEYDQLDVAGALALGGASLDLSVHTAYTVQVSDQYVIVENDGTDIISGRFVAGVGSTIAAGTMLGEGDIVTTNFLGSGYSAKISYVGGDGNDVVLSVLPPPGSPVFGIDPISADSAEIDLPYAKSIAGSALDGDGDPLVYSKISGPAWLVVNPGGSLSGTPVTADLGVNTFTVQVADDDGNTDTATLTIRVTPRKLIGLWEFNDAANLTKATIGSDLILAGSDQAITGVDASDGAARIGVGSHYIANHGIAGNGGGSKVNEYTLVIDMKYPASSASKWISIFQTDAGNSNDADCFVRNSNGTIGVAATGYSSWALAQETWVRIVVSVDNGTHYKTYADGVLIKTGNIQAVDGRFSLDSALLFFADENGEDNAIDVSAIRIYNESLSDVEAAGLGSVHSVDFDNDGVIDEVDLDDDNDGMSDAWEVGNGLNPLLNDFDEDADGDGYTNGQEYLADSDPQDGAIIPTLKLNAADLLNNEVEVSFKTSSERYYTVEYNDGLLAPGWKDVGQSFVGNGMVMSMNLGVAEPKRFYRLRIELP